MKQYTKFLISILLIAACSQQEDNLVDIESNNAETTTTIISQENKTEGGTDTTTTLKIEQIDKFQNSLFVISQEKSTASYLAPKDFLNSKLEIVRGSTNKINGGFELTLDECEQADSCLYINNLFSTNLLNHIQNCVC